MQGNFTKDSIPFRMMTDFYNLVRNYWEVEENKEYWTSLVDSLEEFWKKYDKETLGFSRRIALEYGNYLEKKYNQNKNQNKKHKKGEKKQ